MAVSVGNVHLQQEEGSKAVFREKPADMPADRIRDCIKAVEAAGVPFPAAYAREMRHFVKAATAGTALSPSITDGLRAQMLADAAQASPDSGLPVKL